MSPSKFHKVFTAMLAVFALIAGSAAFAAKAASLTSQQSAAVQKISAYFNSIKTLQGEFTQISPKGNVSSGIFHILKPGKLRFEYSPPNPFLIVSDGTWVVVKNRAKNRSDEYPLSKTPLRLMLSRNVDLLKQAVIKEVESQDGLTTVTLEDRDQLVPGHLILVFDDAKNALQQWSVVDGKGRRTTVSLNKIVVGAAVDSKLFKVKRKDPSKSKIDR
ncbi:MAG: outer membrane lipoprotein carrier protein LolA [Hyphomicrobiales bacterium]|nr:outer membrane lipoprotein carrier protein LolA [Hyphomicrobiales bacterium]